MELQPTVFSSGLSGLVAFVGEEVQIELALHGNLLAILSGELLAANDVAATDADADEEILLNVREGGVLLRRQACVNAQIWPRTVVFDQGDLRVTIRAAP